MVPLLRLPRLLRSLSYIPKHLPSGEVLPSKRARRSKKSHKEHVHEGSPANTNASTGTDKNSEDQYHHIIPRFVLRRFQGGKLEKNEVQSSKGRSRTCVDPANGILVYDMATKTLKTRPISGVFGIKNLYRDIRDTQNVNALEQKLSVLENKAAVVIRRLHEDLCGGESSLTRRSLEDFRKFLFLMHFRNAALTTSYFEPTNPASADSRDLIKKIRSRLGLSTAVEVWLHFLRYYLEKSHDQIIEHAMEEHKKFGLAGLASMLLSRLDPTMEHSEALAYQGLADACYLCIWQAADGEEFVLGSESFGMWEGRTFGIPCLHRVFVISPQIAIILRANYMRKELPQLPQYCISSNFAGIDSAPATPQYNGKVPESIDELRQHKASAVGKHDIFTFKITKLNHAQMNTVNFLTLDHFLPNASFTFLSKEKMLRTVREFCRSPATHRIPLRSNYKPLMEQLSIMLGQDPGSTGDASSARADPAAGKGPEDSTHPDTRFLGGMMLFLAYFCGDDSDNDDK